jgi:hypothetical protein
MPKNKKPSVWKKRSDKTIHFQYIQLIGMKHTSFSPFLILCLLSALSAGAQDPDSKIYEACCGAEPVEFAYGQAYAYVPNVFTPNEDDKNDYFFPYINEHIVGVDAFLIYTAVGDTLMFDRPGFDFKNIKNYGWDGKRYDGSVFEGLFRYEVTVMLKTGGLFRIRGKACRIVCSPKAEVFKTKEGCLYADQVDEKGKLDKKVKTKELGCY